MVLLEELLVRIVSDAQLMLAGNKEAVASIESVNLAMQRLVRTSQILSKDMGRFAGSITAFSRAAAGLNDAAIGKSVLAFESLATKLAGIQIPNIAPLAGSLSGLASSVRQLANLSNAAGTNVSGIVRIVGTLGRHAPGIDTLATAFNNLQAGIVPIAGAAAGLAAIGPSITTLALASADLATPVAAKGITNLGVLSQNLASLAALGPGTAQAVQGLSGLSAIPQHLAALDTAAVTNASASLGRIGNFLRSLRRLPAGGFGTVGADLAAFGQSMSAALPSLSGTDFRTASLNLSRIGTALNAFRRVNTTQLAAVGAALPTLGLQIKTFALQLSDPAIVAASGAIGKIATLISAMSRMSLPQIAAFTAGLGGKPLLAVNQLAGGMTNLHTTTVGTTTALGRMTGSMGILTRMGMNANQSFSTLRLTIAGVGLLGAATFARFDRTMAQVLARVGDLSGRTRGMIQGAIFDVAARSVTSPADLAGSMQIMIRSHMNAAMAARALAIAEDFAVASGMEMDQATNALVNTMTAFGMVSGDVETHLGNMRHLADMFIVTGQRVNVTVDDLTESLTHRFLAVLNQTQTPLEEGIALLGAFGAAGMRGIDAGRQAAMFVSRLQTSAVSRGQQWEWFTEESIFHIRDGIRTLRPLGEVIGVLERGMARLDPVAQRAMLLTLGFAEESMPSILRMMGFSRVVDDLTVSLRNVGGASADAAAIIRRSFGEQMRNVWNNVRLLGITIGEHVAPVIGYLGDRIRDLGTWFRSLSPEFQRVIVWGSLIAASFGTVSAVFATIGGPVLASLSVLGTVLTAIGSFVGVFGLVGTAILAVVAAVWLLIGGLTVAVGMVAGADLLGGFGNMLTIVRQIGVTIGSFWVNNLIRAGEALRDLGTTAFGFFVNFRHNMDALSEWFRQENQDNFQNLGLIAATVFYNMLHNVRQVFTTIGAFITWFMANLPAMWEDAGTIIGRVYEAVVRGFETVMDTVNRIWTAFWGSAAGEAVQQGLDQIGPAVRAWFANLGNPQQANPQQAGRNLLAVNLLRRPQIAGMDTDESLGRFQGLVRAGSFQAMTLAQLTEVQTRLRGLPINNQQMQVIMDAIERDVAVAIALRQIVPNATAAIRRDIQQAVGGVQLATRPLVLPPMQFNPLMQPTPQHIQQRVEELRPLFGMGAMGGPMGMLGPLGAGVTRPLFTFPDIRTDTDALRAAPPINPQALAAMSVLGGISPMGMALPSLTHNLGAAIGLGLLPGIRGVARAAQDFENLVTPQVPGGRGGQGPGFEFRQISLARMMVGGPEVQRIEEQRVRAPGVESRLDQQYEAIREQTTVIREQNQRPARMGP